MDFFNAQREAHKSTKRLILLFACAVIGLVFGLYLLSSTFLAFSGYGKDWSNWAVFLSSCVVTFAIVGGGTTYKINQLRGGGAAVCRMMRARPVPLTAPDREMRRLRNVVEEMAVAAGLPVPDLFVMEDERGINAFAAGYTPSDAAICVTRGCIEQFSRDELQGVVAHEFSHILNGDMRLNIRLMGVLHGILCISLAGYLLLRNGHMGGGRRGGAIALLGLGLGLVILGSIGALFARLIKAAVSRQREFLADASAVQFTRNPAGIRDALTKIGGFAKSSNVGSVQARSASHMFFANALFGGISDWFATHPPIEDRILAVDKEAMILKRATAAEASAAPGAGTTPAGVASVTAGFAGTTHKVSAAATVESVGHMTPEQVAYGRRFLDELPLDVSVALRDPFGARCVIYCMLLDHDRDTRRNQFKVMREESDPATVEETLSLSASVTRLERRFHLPLIDLAMPALRTMSLSQARTFRKNVESLINADENMTLFEFALEKILTRHLDTTYVGPRDLKVRHTALDDVLEDCRRILSTLAHHGHDRGLAAHQAFDDGAETLLVGELKPMPVEECTHAHLDRSLDRLAAASPELKRTALTAFAHTVASDGELTTTEAELLRAVSDAMDCPMPPIQFAPCPVSV